MQVGTLHIVDKNSKVDSGRALAMPAGRSYFEPVNPLAWDISDTNVYAVSFLDHPLNDRFESIKKFSVNSLIEWSTGVKAEDMIMMSAEYNMLTYNEPYKFMVQKNNVMNNFFFDGIMWNGAYWMVLSNNGQASVWKYENENWAHSEMSSFESKGYFTLVEADDELKLITNTGDVFKVNISGINFEQKLNKGVVLNEGVVIEDRDNSKIKFVPHSAFNSQATLHEIINESGITLY